jgi:hypothetical protein
VLRLTFLLGCSKWLAVIVKYVLKISYIQILYIKQIIFRPQQKISSKKQFKKAQLKPFAGLPVQQSENLA